MWELWISIINIGLFNKPSGTTSLCEIFPPDTIMCAKIEWNKNNKNKTFWLLYTKITCACARSISIQSNPFTRWIYVKQVLFVGGLMSYLRYLCLRIVASNTYCVVFFNCFPSSCVPYFARFSAFLIDLQCFL